MLNSKLSRRGFIAGAGATLAMAGLAGSAMAAEGNSSEA